LTHYLLKNRESNIVKAVTGDQKKAKKAILSFSKLEEADQLQLLSIHLQTGRPHQIRVQLSTEGYPIWGDYKYGLNQPDGREIALKAVELIFEHPVKKEEMRFELPPPKVEPWSRFSTYF
jgi:23S rRNA pseudouridine1911/1915/1917 synthase